MPPPFVPESVSAAVAVVTVPPGFRPVFLVVVVAALRLPPRGEVSPSRGATVFLDLAMMDLLLREMELH